MKRLLALFVCVPAFAATWYVAPDGAEANAGDRAGSPTTLTRALSRLGAGDTLCLHAGRYVLTERVTLAKSGTAQRPIRIEAVAGERPILDGTKLQPGPSGQVIRLTGDYYALTDLEVANAPLQGVLIQGSHNRFERCVSHHNGGPGFGVTLSHGDTTNANGERAAYNQFVNCDAYLNFDWNKTKAGKRRPGTDADGFACSLSSGKGNAFYGCRSWCNSDDGWDLFESGFGVVIENCWTWHNGVWTDFKDVYKANTGEELTAEVFSGDGNGFKLGGNHSTGGTGCNHASSGINVLRSSISFLNHGKGIDQNNHQDGVVVENCLSFDNRSNVRFWKTPNAGRPFVFRNNITFGEGTAESAIKIPHVAENNTWQGAVAAQPADFVSLKTDDASAPRAADGSLPARFGRLQPGSKLIDAGVKTQAVSDPGIALAPIVYRGAAPDLAPIECR